MKYWLISEADAQALRAVLTGDALHTLESGLHTTDALPADAIPADMTARDFAVHFLDPVAGLAHRAGLVYAGIVAEVEPDDDDAPWLGDCASALQLGDGAQARGAVRELVQMFATAIERGRP